MVCTVQTGLYVADDRIHPFEIRQIAGLSSASNDDLMMAIGIGDTVEAGQPIRQYEGGGCKAGFRPVRDSLPSEARDWGQLEMLWMTIGCQGDRSDKRHFVLGAPADFTPNPFSPEIDIIDLNDPPQACSFVRGGPLLASTCVESSTPWDN